MSGILDLSGADTSGFEAATAGSYNCRVSEIEMAEVSGQGKLPAGVPMVKVRFKPEEGQGYNGLFFGNYPLPTDEQHDNAARMRGSFVNFLVALGEDKQKITTKGFDISKLEDLLGRECVVRVSKEPMGEPDEDGNVEWTNRVKTVKPAGSPTGHASSEPGVL